MDDPMLSMQDEQFDDSFGWQEEMSSMDDAAMGGLPSYSSGGGGKGAAGAAAAPASPGWKCADGTYKPSRAQCEVLDKPAGVACGADRDRMP
jgi:hypothetical protein